MAHMASPSSVLLRVSPSCCFEAGKEGMVRLALLPALLLVLAAAGCAAAATIEVEHSLDGGKTYSPAGTITMSTSVSVDPLFLRAKAV